MNYYDIENMKQRLYSAIDHGDDDTVYRISVELDTLIVEYYKYCLMKINN